MASSLARRHARRETYRYAYNETGLRLGRAHAQGATASSMRRT
ncbi:hypothetical protein [uncultured Actinomyces sp.]